MSLGKDPDQGQGWKDIEEKKFFEESCLNFSVNKKFDNVGSGLARVGYDQCCQKLFLEKHGCLDKKERKKRAENPNKTGKKQVFRLKFL